MPMWPYENFDACVLDQTKKGHSDEAAKKICGSIKAKVEASENFEKELSEDTKVSGALAKRIITNLVERGMDVERIGSVIWKIKKAIVEEAIAEKLNKTNDEEIGAAIDEILEEEVRFMSEIVLADKGGGIEDKDYEICTTAKQTDWRYGDFQFSKKDLENIAKNFNDDIVGTEIPVDLNHDPDHIAYAWVKPGSMYVSESSKLKGQYSLYARLHKFTAEGKDYVENGKMRYFSVHVQPKMEKFVDNVKKTYSMVLRSLALTNLPVVKDMAPTLSEKEKTLFSNHEHMEKTEAELKLAETEVKLSDAEKALAEKDTAIKELSEKVAAQERAQREKDLSAKVDELCLSEDKNIGFKGGEKEKVLEFVLSLTPDQADAYFKLHTDLITSVDLSEHGEGGEEGGGTDAGVSGGEDPNVKAESMAKELSEKENISLMDAYDKVLSENPKLAKAIEESLGY